MVWAFPAILLFTTRALTRAGRMCPSCVLRNGGGDVQDDFG